MISIVILRAPQDPSMGADRLAPFGREQPAALTGAVMRALEMADAESKPRLLLAVQQSRDARIFGAAVAPPWDGGRARRNPDRMLGACDAATSTDVGWVMALSALFMGVGAKFAGLELAATDVLCRRSEGVDTAAAPWAIGVLAGCACVAKTIESSIYPAALVDGVLHALGGDSPPLVAACSGSGAGWTLSVPEVSGALVRPDRPPCRCRELGTLLQQRVRSPAGLSPARGPELERPVVPRPEFFRELQLLGGGRSRLTDPVFPQRPLGREDRDPAAGPARAMDAQGLASALRITGELRDAAGQLYRRALHGAVDAPPVLRPLLSGLVAAGSAAEQEVTTAERGLVEGYLVGGAGAGRPGGGR